MVSPRDRARPARRRIAGERARTTTGTRPEQDRAPDDVRPGSAPADDVSPDTAPADDGTADRPTVGATDSPTAEPAAPERSSVSEHTVAPPSATPEATSQRSPSTALATEEERDPGPPNWVLAVLAGLLAVALALLGFVGWREYSQRQAGEQAARALHSALIEAPSVAERAAKDLLSFRHDTLDKDVAQARHYLTAGYRPDYIASIKDVVAAPAKDVGAVVDAEVLASGVVEARGGRSDVLLFVNQTTTSATSAEPKTALNRVVFTMVHRDGRWMVDEIKAL